MIMAATRAPVRPITAASMKVAQIPKPGGEFRHRRQSGRACHAPIVQLMLEERTLRASRRARRFSFNVTIPSAGASGADNSSL